jgi:NhaP-type Na+/H+ and K+/H+ antiporter
MASRELTEHILKLQDNVNWSHKQKLIDMRANLITKRYAVKNQEDRDYLTNYISELSRQINELEVLITINTDKERQQKGKEILKNLIETIQKEID